MAALTNVELLAVVANHRPVPTPVREAGVRFAFYGRMSTSEFQDPQTSRAWQRAVSDELIDGVGSVVVEFFDVGRSRRWSWWERPEASALLAAAARSDRVFDAVVIGEYERAFYGDQFREVVSRLKKLGVAVWLPEAGGPVELDSPVHQALMVLLGAQAQREVARARQRVPAAMRAQTSQTFDGLSHDLVEVYDANKGLLAAGVLRVPEPDGYRRSIYFDDDVVGELAASVVVHDPTVSAALWVPVEVALQFLVDGASVALSRSVLVSFGLDVNGMSCDRRS